MIGEVKKQSLTLMTAALGFVAAFVWKDAILKWFEPLTQGGTDAMGLTLQALIVTAVVVVITIVLAKWLGSEEEKK